MNNHLGINQLMTTGGVCNRFHSPFIDMNYRTLTLTIIEMVKTPQKLVFLKGKFNRVRDVVQSFGKIRYLVSVQAACEIVPVRLPATG